MRLTTLASLIRVKTQFTEPDMKVFSAVPLLFLLLTSCAGPKPLDFVDEESFNIPISPGQSLRDDSDQIIGLLPTGFRRHKTYGLNFLNEGSNELFTVWISRGRVESLEVKHTQFFRFEDSELASVPLRWQSSKLKTLRGISIGSSGADITRTYGTPSSILAEWVATMSNDRTTYVYKGRERVLEVSSMQGIVIRIKVYLK